MSAPRPMPTRSDTAAAKARAKLARLIAAAFSDDGEGAWGAMNKEAVAQEARDAAVAIGIDARLVDGLFGAFSGSRDPAAEAQRLLGHTVRSECPPYELEYRSAEVFQQSQTLADIRGFYRAFGFDAAGPLADRADHAAAEWEFLAVLAIKEALARNATQVECCIAAQRLFLAEHAGAWMPAFFERIRRAGEASWLGRAAELAEAVLRSWCAERDVVLGSRWLELRPVSEDDATITCGAPGAVELGPTLAAALQEGGEA